jgi:hypothetical protein
MGLYRDSKPGRGANASGDPFRACRIKRSIPNETAEG